MSGHPKVQLFLNITFFLDEELPHASSLARQIKNQGGRLSEDPNDANYFVLHPETKRYAKMHHKLQPYSGHFIPPHWIEDCIIFRKLMSFNNGFYNLPIPPPPTANRERRTVIIKRSEGQGRSGARVKYTESEDEQLARAVAKYSGRMENDTLCRRMAKLYPQHTWPSWKEHWRKVKRDWVDARVTQILSANPELPHEATSSEDEPEIIYEGPEITSIGVATPSNEPSGYSERKRKLAPLPGMDLQDALLDIGSASKRARNDEGGIKGDITVPQPNGVQIDPQLDAPPDGQSIFAVPSQPSNELSARQKKRLEQQHFADILWASSGDEAMAKHYLSVELEEQVELLSRLWSPEHDDRINTAKDVSDLQRVASERNCSLEDVQNRQEYITKHRKKSRLPIGAARWPWNSE